MGFVFAILVSGLAPSVHAQYPGYVTDSNDTGLPTYGSFISSQVDMVNLGTGGLSIRVPIVSRKGRGIDYLYVETYESKLWTMVPTVTQLGTNYPITTLNWVGGSRPGPGANWTARDNVHASVNWTEQTYTCAPTSPQGGDAGGEVTSIQSTFLVRSNWIYKSPDGAKHQVPLRNNYPIDYPGQCGDSGPGNTNVVANTDNDHVQVDISQDTVEWHTGILITGADGITNTRPTISAKKIGMETSAAPVAFPIPGLPTPLDVLCGLTIPRARGVNTSTTFTIRMGTYRRSK